MKHIPLIILILVAVGLVGLGTYQYTHRTKPNQGITVSEAVKERNQAVDLMNLHDAVNKTNLDNATTQLANLTNQKTNICTQLKANKLVNPYCP